MVDELTRQHEVIFAAANELLAMVKRRPHAHLADVIRLRAHLCRLMKDHHSAEEAIIFTPLLRCRGMIQHPDLKRILHDIQSEKSRFAEGTCRWTPEAISTDWNGYTDYAEQSVASLAEMMRIEEEEFFPPVMKLAAA